MGVNVYTYKYYSSKDRWRSTSVIKSVFLIGSCDTPLGQRASCLAQHTSLFGPDGAIDYDYIVTNSVKCLLIGSKCIPNSTHASHC